MSLRDFRIGLCGLARKANLVGLALTSLVPVFFLSAAIPGLGHDHEELDWWLVTKAELTKGAITQKERKELSDAAVIRLKQKPAFAEFLRKSLETEPSDDLRFFIGNALLKAFGESAGDDIIRCLRDPADSVRMLGLVAASHYNIASVAHYVPASLLSSNRLERSTALRTLSALMKDQGLMYYVMMLNDEDTTVGENAAISLRKCDREAVERHALTYLQRVRAGNGDREVANELIKTLHCLRAEPIRAQIDLQSALDDWIKKLEHARPSPASQSEGSEGSGGIGVRP